MVVDVHIVGCDCLRDAGINAKELEIEDGLLALSCVRVTDSLSRSVSTVETPLHFIVMVYDEVVW